MGNIVDDLRTESKRQVKGVINSLLKDITDALEEGYTVKAVYKLLHDRGTITCSYAHFAGTLKKIMDGDISKPKKRREMTEKSTRRNGFRLKSLEQDDFE